MRIGIDVGGTNTDAVLVDSKNKVVAWNKSPTTTDVSDGVIEAATAILQEAQIGVEEIDAVMIGTTHFSNAFVERKRLLEVGIIRIALPATEAIMPHISWPEDVKACVGNHVFLVRGGYQYDGRINSELDEDAVAAAARAFKSRGLKTVAITALFSSVNPDMELRAAEIVREEMGDVSITLSHTTGSIGILMRENSAIINASLSELANDVIHSFDRALKMLNVSAPLYISQNDGTLMNSEFAVRYPVLTFAAGLTNSLRGAAMLSNIKNGIVVDVGGTTTDIGVLVNGFPRESSMTTEIGGIRTNFRMPDVLTLGVGGGSLIVEQPDGAVSVGPQSVGYRLTEHSRVFGGETLTATDVAVAAGQAEIGDASLVSDIPELLVSAALREIRNIVSVGVDRMKTSSEAQTLILVGGGSILLGGLIPGADTVLSPGNASVANAIGAAIALIGGEVDKVYNYSELGRETSIQQAREEAIAQAIKAGAEDDGSLEIVNIEEFPLPYVNNGAVRVRVKAVGNLKIRQRNTTANQGEIK